MKKSLKRYTELSFLIDMLATKEITLLNPNTWDDRNDSFYIEQYARTNGLKSTYALCLTEASETYHHWKIFSSGTSGVCIEFDRERFLSRMNSYSNLRMQAVNYKKIKELQDAAPILDELPFLKRTVFRDEQEFRLFVGSDKALGAVLRFKFDLTSINRVILSPWLPQSVASHVKKLVRSIPDCSNLKVYRSTLIENENWKNFATNFE